MAEWSLVDLLPGVWVGVLATLLVAALRRWYDRVPWPVLAVFALPLVLLFAPALFGGRVLLPLDNLRGQAPFRQLPPTEPHGNILQGDLIELVTPSIAATREALVDGRWPLWNPRVGAGMPLLADPQAQAFAPLVRLVDVLPLPRAPGALAALRVFVALLFFFLLVKRLGLATGPAVCGALAYGLGGFVVLWVGWPLANTAALLPFAVYAAVRAEQVGGRRDLFLLALATLALLLGGHPETILYALAVALAFLLARFLGRREPLAARLRALRGPALALLVAVLAAAPVLLPTLDLLPHTLRASRLYTGSESTAAPGDLARRLLPIAAPNAYGNSRFVDYWGLTNTNEDASGFVGTAALLAALLALFPCRRLPQERLALGIAGLCLVWLARPPGLDRLLGFLPASAFESRRLLLPLSFCLAYLAACTFERFRRGELRRGPLLAVAATLALLLAWGYVAHPYPGDPERLAVLRFGWLRWQERFLVVTTLLLALAARSWWRKPALAGVAAVLLAELVLAHGSANPPAPLSLAFPENEAIRFLESHLGADRMAALDRAFPPNLPALYGLSDVRIYNPMTPERYAAYLAPVTARFWGEVPELGSPQHPLYGRLGVRYVLTEPGERLPPPLTLVFSDPTAWIYERPDPLPRLALAPGASGRGLRVVHDEIERIEAVVVPRRDGSGAGATGDLVLVSSVFQDGGWRVLADGRSVPATTADGPFLTAKLPASTHRLDLLYRPRPFLVGCLVLALALAIGAAVWVPPPARRWDSDRPPGSR